MVWDSRYRTRKGRPCLARQKKCPGDTFLVRGRVLWPRGRSPQDCGHRAIPSTKPDRKVGLFSFTRRAVGLRPPLRRHAKRTGTQRELVIARSEATWESPGTFCKSARCSRRLPEGELPAGQEKPPWGAAFGLAMTQKIEPGPSFGGAIRTPREGCPYGNTCRAVGLRPPLRRLAKRTGAEREHVIANQCAHWCGNPVDFAGTTNGRLRSISGIATSGYALLAMTCSFSGFCRARCLRTAPDGTPGTAFPTHKQRKTAPRREPGGFGVT